MVRSGCIDEDDRGADYQYASELLHAENEAVFFTLRLVIIVKG